ncbi:MAG: hypothetical protein R3258_04430 [Acidimicrobiia bacterium]|nr:hypothetical protein [Acidimicrobiia bacterium]
MVTLYAISLVLGIVALIWVILGGALAANLGRPEKDPGTRLGLNGRSAVGAILGFGMGGMAAEFSPLGFSTPVSALLAVAGAGVGVVWVRYIARQQSS